MAVMSDLTLPLPHSLLILSAPSCPIGAAALHRLPVGLVGAHELRTAESDEA
ncbi:hypothetical protein DM860_000731 [Cuscuta australis]|uniref:Uncharacterized protein n=1 Tax=Cuscuta australis TaxID=267555 RepID=A0A328CX18_9ASTE|nr:hypothetical protein DM860_000731 [Cuscuta australis]